MNVMCVGYRQQEKFFTLNKIYTWEDGRLTSDQGHVYTDMVDGTDVEKWRLGRWYDFVCVDDLHHDDNMKMSFDDLMSE